MKIDQIAFGCRNEQAFDSVARTAEAVDEVTFRGFIKQWTNAKAQTFESCVGHLAFNYDMGIEIEHLWYPNQHDTFHNLIVTPYGGQSFFLSHLGSHVENIDAELAKNVNNIRDNVVMDVTTIKHTNPKIQDRSYRYVIIDQRRTQGYFLKLIQRLAKS